MTFDRLQAQGSEHKVNQPMRQRRSHASESGTSVSGIDLTRIPAYRTGSSAPGGGIGGAGVPLDAGTRGFFESGLGYELSGVRIHTGHAAGVSALDEEARAYTIINLFLTKGSAEWAGVKEMRHLRDSADNEDRAKLMR